MNDEEIEQRLRAMALRPRDEQFTRRVLATLPARSRSPLRVHVLRSFALATRFGLVVALLAATQHWYLSGSGGGDTILAIVLFAVPVFAAISLLCGPVMPRSLRRLLWRPGRNWR